MASFTLQPQHISQTEIAIQISHLETISFDPHCDPYGSPHYTPFKPRSYVMYLLIPFVSTKWNAFRVHDRVFDVTISNNTNTDGSYTITYYNSR